MTHHISWLSEPCKKIDEPAIAAAELHQLSLTKPAGSLGILEEIAVNFAGWQGNTKPCLDHVLLRVFAGDHGVCDQNVSAFPQEVTQQMVMNFIQGGAAINVLAKNIGADFAVVNLGTVQPVDDSPKLVNAQLAPSTEDFSKAPAMTETLLSQSLNCGREQLLGSKANLFIGGEMGIGNTSSASALYSALLNLAPEITVGPGTGVDEEGQKLKRIVIDKALTLHAEKLQSPISILQHLGGMEIAALVGAYLTAAQIGVPMLIDGFISTAAALLTTRLCPDSRDWMIFSHQSAEPAHSMALETMNATPLLNLGLRLGEGSGAALATSIIQSALDLHNNMASFTDAGVSNA